MNESAEFLIAGTHGSASVKSNSTIAGTDPFTIEAAGKSARSWSAPALWRFGNRRGMDGRQNFVLNRIALGESGSDYRPSSVAILRRVDSPRRFANQQRKGVILESIHKRRVPAGTRILPPGLAVSALAETMIF